MVMRPCVPASRAMYDSTVTATGALFCNGQARPAGAGRRGGGKASRQGRQTTAAAEQEEEEGEEGFTVSGLYVMHPSDYSCCCRIMGRQVGVPHLAGHDGDGHGLCGVMHHRTRQVMARRTRQQLSVPDRPVANQYTPYLYR